MAGLISNPNAEPALDPWTLWRQSIALAGAGYGRLADSNLQKILAAPNTPQKLRAIVLAKMEASAPPI